MYSDFEKSTKILEIRGVKNEDSGAINFFESFNDIPFEIKRFYYITGATSGTERGKHAHKKLQQFLFCPYGSITLTLDNGKEKKEIYLDSPNKGILLTDSYWRDMSWIKSDSVLCIAASEFYCEDDYIRSYDEFLKFVSGR